MKWDNYNREEVIWAAGLYEGEGTCFARKSKGRVHPRIVLDMTDEEPVLRFRKAMLGVGAYYKDVSRRNKPGYVLVISHFEQVQMVAAMLFSQLSPRRKEQITNCFLQYKDYKLGRTSVR